MERPQSMPLKEFLVKKLSLKLNIPERTINAVITDQFTTAFQATTNNNSIELSGFGKFVFNQKKAHAQMARYESQVKSFTTLLATEVTPGYRADLNRKLINALKNIEYLKPKLI